MLVLEPDYSQWTPAGRRPRCDDSPLEIVVSNGSLVSVQRFVMQAKPGTVTGDGVPGAR